MVDVWTVTDEDGQFERTYDATYHPGTDDEWALDAQDAAEMWAEWACSQEAEYPEERVAVVTDPDGNVTRMVVTFETVPVFHARLEVTND